MSFKVEISYNFNYAPGGASIWLHIKSQSNNCDFNGNTSRHEGK